VRAFYINLARSPGRRDNMEAQSARLGLGLERIDAVDGRLIPEGEHDRLCPVPAEGVRLARSELACYRSHLLAWGAVVASGEAWGAVFEDDVFLADDTGAALSDAGWIPGDADLVRLSSNSQKLTLSPGSEGPGGRKLMRLRSPTVDIGGYVIAARHARRLLASPGRFERPVDRLLLDPRDGAVIYQMSPSLAVQAKWAEFGFLSEAEAKSQIQTERPPRRRKPFGWAKVARELGAFRRKVLFPIFLPVTQALRPASERLTVAAVPFRK
jgi:glycosyl transferase family 25